MWHSGVLFFRRTIYICKTKELKRSLLLCQVNLIRSIGKLSGANRHFRIDKHGVYP